MPERGVWPKLIMCILPVAEIVVGAVHQNDCPKQPFIPIYLEVMGALGLLYIALSFLCRPDDLSRCGMAFNIMHLLIRFSWFFTGNWWIYSIYQPNYNQTTTDVDPYCNKTLYLFAFWTTNLAYIIVPPLIVFALCRYFHVK
ncbi:transmembrane protein 272-like [Centropristis striata]|uniref:transmembrane protein 272-like n=1 Tax=Centropristis striata TaxID=184440 RepID=UPI0027E16E0B|nr:transmembrane protein 272-like [Centropristis striata]